MGRTFFIWALASLALMMLGARPVAAKDLERALVHGPEFVHAQQTRSDEGSIEQAIRRAALVTGVDYGFLMAKAHIESGLDAQAKSRSSSAAGLFQFIEETWLQSVAEHEGILEGQTGPIKTQARSKLLQLRYDPVIAALMAGATTRDNAERLHEILGREATHTELYLAHFLGSGGAAKFLRAWQRNPSANATSLFPRAARANKAIFYSGNAPRTLNGVMLHFDAKLRQAKIDSGVSDGVVTPDEIQRAFLVAKQNSRSITSPAFETVSARGPVVRASINLHLTTSEQELAGSMGAVFRAGTAETRSQAVSFIGQPSVDANGARHSATPLAIAVDTAGTLAFETAFKDPTKA